MHDSDEKQIGGPSPCIELGRKAPFSVFLSLFKQQHAENAANNAQTDILELQKLQNALRIMLPKCALFSFFSYPPIPL